MTERRPFPPSPRRLVLARQAGLSSASAVVVGAVACVGAIVVAVMVAGAAAARVGAWIAEACRAADGSRGGGAMGGDAMDSSGGGAIGGGPLHGDGTLNASDAMTGGELPAIGDIAIRVLELVAPILAAAAIAALVAHVAQTRALWLPRRRIAAAPSIEPARVRRSALDVTNAAVIGVVAFAWLWLTAPRLAQLFALDFAGHREGGYAASGAFSASAALPAIGSAIASLVVALAIAWIVVGAIDALVRRAELAQALAMTVTEKRDDDRLAAADPRWRAQRAALARGPSASTAVARASLLLLGDDVAAAIAWDARRQPVPLRVATGRRAQATQLLGLARRHRVPVHRDAQLAAALVGGEGPVPESYWARLAEIIAAVQAANTGRDVSR